MGVGLDSPWHWAILAIVVFALFGYKKLPDATRSVGRSLRIFKSEMKGMNDDQPESKAAKTEQPRAPRQVIEGQTQPAAQPTAAQPTAASQPSAPSQPSRPTPPSQPTPTQPTPPSSSSGA